MRPFFCRLASSGRAGGKNVYIFYWVASLLGRIDAMFSNFFGLFRVSLLVFYLCYRYSMFLDILYFRYSMF